MAFMKNAVLDILIGALGFSLGMAIWAALGHGGSYLTSLEAHFYPMIKVNVPQALIYRDGEKACFSLDETKLKAGRPGAYEFKGKSRFSDPIPLSDAYLAGPDNVARPKDVLQEHAPGEKWLRRYCFTTRGNFPPEDAILVTGSVTHHRKFLWDITTELPQFEIPRL